MPEALCWARRGMKGIKSLHFDWNAGHFRVLEAYWPAVAPRYRGLLLVLQGMLITRPELARRIEALRGEVAERDGRIETLAGELEASRQGHVIALARRRASRFGLGRMEVGIVLNSDWAEYVRKRQGPGATLELRRNGRVVACACLGDASDNRLRIVERWRLPAVGGALYSLHEAVSGEVLAVLAAPAFLRARRVAGAVESRPRSEVRGWVLDSERPERVRKVAVHVDGCLREVIDADAVIVEFA